MEKSRFGENLFTLLRNPLDSRRGWGLLLFCPNSIR